MLFPKYRRQSEQEIKIEDKQEISKARYIAIWMRMVGQEARSSNAINSWQFKNVMDGPTNQQTKQLIDRLNDLPTQQGVGSCARN